MSKALFKFMSCQFTIKLNRSEIPIKTTIRSLSISSILDFSNESGLGLRSRDQSFSKVCVFSKFDPSTVASGERFQKFAFSHRFRVDGTWKRNKMSVAFSNVFTWTLRNRNSIARFRNLHISKHKSLQTWRADPLHALLLKVRLFQLFVLTRTHR